MARSLHASEGVVLYSPQVSFGTAVTPATPVGICDFNATDEGDYRQFYTVGNRNLHQNKAGIARVDWQVRVPALGSRDVLALGVRNAGALPWVTWGFGSDPYDAAPEAWQVMDCKVGNMSVQLDGGGILSGSLSGIGGQKSSITSLTAAAAAAGTDEPLMSYESILLLAGAAFEVKSFQFDVNHNLFQESVIRGTAAAAGRQRLWDYLTEGYEEITGRVTLARVHSKDFQAACPAVDGAMKLTLTPACAGVSPFYFELGAVEFLSQTRNMPSDGYGDFELPFNAKSLTIANVV